jgi:[acyl-carrier-protein] S-malonyltransferase
VDAVIFPGQGSQKPGMGSAWAATTSWSVIETVSDILRVDVAWLLVDADAVTLQATQNAQVAAFALGLVLLDAAAGAGLQWDAAAGHSLGEYTALVAAGALDYDDGLRLVAERGAAMQDAADNLPGTMAVVMGLDEDAAESACQRAEGDVWVANYNAPGQVVIAGAADAIETAAAIAKSLGAKRVMSIPVGGAFHTPYMAPARDRLRKALLHVQFRDPEPTVLANVDARSHDDAADWPGLLSAQLCSPVRWQQILRALAGAGTRTLVELGPGGVLTGVARRTLEGSEVVAISVSTPDDLDKLAVALTGSEPFEAFSEAHGGERFFMTERLLVSPGTGLFQPVDELMAVTPGVRGAPTREGDELPAARIEVGTLIGYVGDREIRSAFGGMLEGVLVLPGERVVTGQPVAWVRPGTGEHAGRGDAA